VVFAANGRNSCADSLDGLILEESDWGLHRCSGVF